jgi:replication-associated recombination protein RarA
MDHVNRATTENPSFEVIPALLSVVKFILTPLKEDLSPLQRALKTDSFSL